MIVKTIPINVKTVGCSLYAIIPKNNVARGSAPEVNIETFPESMYFSEISSRMDGRANDNAEWSIRNMMLNVKSEFTNSDICPKFVNGNKINVIIINE